MEYELEKSPSLAELLSVIINREDVEGIINRPVRFEKIISFSFFF